VLIIYKAARLCVDWGRRDHGFIFQRKRIVGLQTVERAWWEGAAGRQKETDGNLNNKMIIKMQLCDAKPLTGLRPRGNSLCFGRHALVKSEFDPRTQYCLTWPTTQICYQLCLNFIGKDGVCDKPQ
jgi:hypothetical protein